MSKLGPYKYLLVRKKTIRAAVGRRALVDGSEAPTTPFEEGGGTQMSHGGAAGNAAGYPSSEGVCSSRRRCDRPVERGMSKIEAAHKQAFVAQPPSQRISLQRTTRPRREPREHAVVSDLIRWYLHSPLLIPARPPRCSTMRNRSLTAIKAITQALLDRRASRVETRNFEILGD